jgi:hypothetical protein
MAIWTNDCKLVVGTVNCQCLNLSIRFTHRISVTTYILIKFPAPESDGSKTGYSQQQICTQANARLLNTMKNKNIAANFVNTYQFASSRLNHPAQYIFDILSTCKAFSRSELAFDSGCRSLILFLSNETMGPCSLKGI